MAITCPHCDRTQPSSDEMLRYCAFCGQRLPELTVAGSQLTPTAPYVNADPDPAPAQVGGYRILRRLGSGGMGQVYEAEPLGGGSHVALKLLSGRLQANPISVERFRQEGRLAAQIAHPRCVFVLRADTDRGRPYIVMELMPGDTLKDLVDRRGPLPAPEAIRLILDVIDGLLEAHRLGVIHRDIKPSNCFLLPDGRVKVGDFGLSKSLGSAAQLTTSGAFLGTVLYASPEQIKGEPVDFASDVYSVCATLYHLLAGRAPFHHQNPTAVLAKIISEDAPDIRGVNPHVPSDLANVVHRGLERDRGRRYATLTELRAALAALVPEQLTFGGMGVRVGAYVLDELIVRAFLVLPTLFLVRSVVHWEWLAQAVPLLLFPLYFLVLEGYTGRSWGKHLVGLRVCRQGTTLPPGFRRAAIRTIVFYLLVTVTLSQAELFLEKIGDGESGPAVLLHLLPLLIGLLILIVPMRRSNDFRGLHEKLSETCVLRLPQVPHPLQLIGRHGDRLLAVPDRPMRFPAAIGPFEVSRAGRIGDQWVAIGDDTVLGRRVLMRVYPDHGGPAVRPAVGRPGRLWPLDHGTVQVEGQPHRWEAFVAPAGAPLPDVVDREHPIRWPEARPILEQLTFELITAEKEGSLPGQLSLDQVWVQPDGRPQLLEFPIVSGSGLTNALGLLKQSAATLLEGIPRAAADHAPIRAPLPRHAAFIVSALISPAGAVTSPSDFAGELQATRDRPTRITRGSRAIQLTMQSAAVSLGLVTMFATVGMYAALLVLESEEYVDRAEQIRAAEIVVEQYATPDGRSRLESDPAFRARIAADPTLIQRLESRIPSDRNNLRATLPGVNREERYFQFGIELLSMEPGSPNLIPRALELDGSPSSIAAPERIWLGPCVQIMFWPVFWAAGAYVLNGGFSYLATGIRIVDSSGVPARRRRSALRAAIVWTPIALLLCVAVIIRAEAPGSGAYLLPFVGAMALLPVYILFALVDPERGPHDRLLGTWLVPR